MRQATSETRPETTMTALPEPTPEPEAPRSLRPVPDPGPAARSSGREARCQGGCTLSLSVAPQASALPAARDKVRVFLRGFAVPERDVFDVVLCMEEACKNAIRFSGSERDIDVTLGVSRADVHLVIRDHGSGFEPRPVDVSHKPDPFEQHGRGLFLLHALMDDVRIRRDRGAIVTARRHIAG